jgi:two-component system, OmpR family, response regulator MprA
VSEMPGVLIVEDDDIVRRVLIEALTDEGYAVRAANDGLEALALLGEWRPRIILLDLMMPVMDGRTFRAEQRARGLADDAALVVLSASRLAEEAGPALGATAVLTKPFDIDDLLAAIDRAAGPPAAA